MTDQDTYALRTASAADIPAPDLPYLPPHPRAYTPGIALVGAGGISAAHLEAYRDAGFNVAVICSPTLAHATARRDAFFPQARVTDDFDSLLTDPSIKVLDLTPHPADRLPLIEAALEAGKHVLSQKPFVQDLATGQRLADLADAREVRLAVNQNGRWAPHMAWMRAAVEAGLIGDITSLQIAINWDHGWIEGTPFEGIPELILYDFAIHWFDFAASLVGPRLQSVQASATLARGQSAKVPLLAQALVQLDRGQASFSFAGATKYGAQDSTYIAGTKGSLISRGPNLGTQEVTLVTAEGRATPELRGTWFNDGFRGAMGELLCAIEEDRTPIHNARDNLTSLALTFAAIKAAHSGEIVRL